MRLPAAGQDLVQLPRCFGCHAEGGKGKVFFDVPGIATIAARHALDTAG